MLKVSRLSQPPKHRALQQQVERYSGRLTAAMEAVVLNERSEWLLLLKNVCCCSPFIAGVLTKNIEILRGLIGSGVLTHPAQGDYFEKRLPSKVIVEAMSDTEFMVMIRVYRQREMARIGIRDLLGWADLPETLSELSRLADTCIKIALHKAEFHQSQLNGDALDKVGLPQQLIVMAMGKLGGNELNYSSDIDLIFFYPASGHTQTEQGTQRSIENEQYFARIGQKLIKYLNDITEDGFVFRVDMRLRPYGDSGALVMSFDAAEIYYQSQGRDWERYAFVKARAVTGRPEHIAELEQILQPFVYRRYLDYGAFESLREMKAKMVKELARKYRANHIKLGPGGIREVEFIVQAFQLIRGGREAIFREREVLKVLPRLGARNVLDLTLSMQISQAYCFLRRTENRMQMMQDQQVHTLPTSVLEQARLAYAMGYQDWSEFEVDLRSAMQLVHSCFMDVFADPHNKDAVAESANHWKEVWLNPGKNWALEQIKKRGFNDSEFIVSELQTLQESHLVRKMSRSARGRLDRLMPALLALIVEQDMSAAVVHRLLDFIRAVARRSVYLSLLLEYPQVLNEVVKLFTASSWLAEYLTRHPVLLDSLITHQSQTLQDKSVLREQLIAVLAEQALDDSETQWDVLRQFKNEQVLWIAAADIDAVLPLMKVSDRLTELAELMLEASCTIASKQLTQQYGEPQAVRSGQLFTPQLAIIAYGKLGGIELGYGSDLDVIFLFSSGSDEPINSGAIVGETNAEKPIDNNTFFLRIARRVVQIMTSHTTNGVLYDMDLRLRPDGDAGLMVHTLDGFARYQREKAWIWEHQALVRARLVVGDAETEQAFTRLREEILCLPRDKLVLRKEILEMRERMRRELSTSRNQEFDLKQGKGGIVDIEFMVQYAVLANASRYPQIVRYTDNIRILESCSEVGIFPHAAADFLIEAYRQLRAELHRLSLLNQSTVIHNISTVEGTLQGVADIWDDMFEVMADREAL